MPRGESIHIGVNRPGGPCRYPPLHYSETNAWRMGTLAAQAGYARVLVLRGEAATRQAVHQALTDAAGSLQGGDTLLLSFSGHGPHERDLTRDEPFGSPDEGWCLADGVLIDDRLSGYWRLFEPGVRIVVVSESCFSGGVWRDDHDVDFAAPSGPRPVVYRGEYAYRTAGDPAGNGAIPIAPCIGRAPANPDGIRATVLLLSASAEEQTARDGLFTRHLLDVWDEGAFRGSYCDLQRQVRDRVRADHCKQEPQIRILGAGDLTLPLETAFHLGHRTAGTAVYRGG